MNPIRSYFHSNKVLQKKIIELKDDLINKDYEISLRDTKIRNLQDAVSNLEFTKLSLMDDVDKLKEKIKEMKARNENENM